MREVRIEDLLASPLVDAAAHLDPARVRLYARAGEDVPPVVVFDTEDGLLLVDGYHRLAAAKLRGAETVTADVRRGSRSDALRVAAELAAVQRGITPDLALARIRERSQGRWSAEAEDS